LQSLSALHESPSAADEEEHVTRPKRATIDTVPRAARKPCLESIRDTLAPADGRFREAVPKRTVAKKGEIAPDDP
jgi:hypothetical protein